MSSEREDSLLRPEQTEIPNKMTSEQHDRRKFLNLASATFLTSAALVTLPQKSNAGGYGPANGAALSPATLDLNRKIFSIDDLTNSGSKKSNKSKRISGLSLEGAQSILEKLAQTILPKEEDDGPKLTEEEARAEFQRLEKAADLKAQLEARADVLGRLGKQPDWIVYGAAILASFGSTTIMHPVDTIKTRLQAGADADTIAAKDEESDTGDGGISHVAEAVKEEEKSGILGSISDLYTGLSANLLKEGPPSGLYLGVYETVKAKLLPLTMVAASKGVADKDTMFVLTPLVVYLLAGGAGEFVGSVVRAPSEAAKTKMQSGMAESPIDAFNQLKDNPAAMINTWYCSLVRDVPFGAIQIAIFELTKEYIIQNPDIDVDVNTALGEALIGAFAGGIGAFVTNPADVVVTNLVTQKPVDKGEKLITPLEMANNLYRDGGAGIFFSGVSSRVLYWAPAIAIFLSLYCRLRNLALNFPA